MTTSHRIRSKSFRLFCLFSGLAMALIVLLHPFSPPYHGKCLRSWLGELTTGETTDEELVRVNSSIRLLGTNAPAWLVQQGRDLKNPLLATAGKARGAIAAVRAMGTSTLPTLLHDLRSHDSWLRCKVSKLS